MYGKIGKLKNMFHKRSNTITSIDKLGNINKSDSEKRNSISGDRPQGLLDRILRKQDKIGESSVKLEEIIDIDKNLELYNKNQLKLLDPKYLYIKGNSLFKTSLIKTANEERLSVLEGEAKTIEILDRQTIKNLRKDKKKFVHIGLIVIGIKGLTRSGVGTKTLITLLDTSWIKNMNKALIGSIEVDMNSNSGLFYYPTDLLKSVDDIENIKIGIETKGYEDYKGDNLSITIGVLGRGSTMSGNMCRLDSTHIINSLSTKGIKLIKSKIIDPSSLAGTGWNLERFVQIETKEKIIVPETSSVYRDLNNNQSIVFDSFIEKISKSQSELDSDEESITSQLP